MFDKIQREILLDLIFDITRAEQDLLIMEDQVKAQREFIEQLKKDIEDTEKEMKEWNESKGS